MEVRISNQIRLKAYTDMDTRDAKRSMTKRELQEKNVINDILKKKT